MSLAEAWPEWALDVSLVVPCWVPITFDDDGGFTLTTGFNLIADYPPGKAVAIVHLDGNEAVERWMASPEAEVWLKRMEAK